ncbi:hypothetical protein WOLCODRAFT_159222 [Wolfiporia cocos MD-104 SS10]|uniref:Uncharacterized protein n=1 Tax=Wolfiporia cocos (strain MD-104) TaxID=742152 RepID=A0A2H3JSK5_WOLCO|nr:hypothetical protein WOLCODRAFT_159222 [Wolfiporia cocos MD-104 SS10]
MVNSLDFKGDPISGLPMYHEHIVQQPLLEWEQPFFDMVTHDLMINDHLRMVNQIFMGKHGRLTMLDVDIHRWVGSHDVLGAHPAVEIHIQHGRMATLSKIEL